MNSETALEAALTTEDCGLGGIADRGKVFRTHSESTHLAPEKYTELVSTAINGEEA